MLWRHDVDCSVHRALALARIEAEAGVSSTYFLLFHGWFYNLLERPVLDRAREIMELGHWLGLHFDVDFYPGLSVEGLSERLAVERGDAGGADGARPPLFSFHNPDVGPAPEYDSTRWHAGMINSAYGRELSERSPRSRIPTATGATSRCPSSWPRERSVNFTSSPIPSGGRGGGWWGCKMAAPVVGMQRARRISGGARQRP